jgi:hypothetical protein
MEKHHSIPQSLSLEERLFADETKRLRARAQGAKSSIEHEQLLRRVRQAETASHIDEWLNSRGLQPPK